MPGQAAALVTEGRVTGQKKERERLLAPALIIHLQHRHPLRETRGLASGKAGKVHEGTLAHRRPWQAAPAGARERWRYAPRGHEVELMLWRAIEPRAERVPSVRGER